MKKYYMIHFLIMTGFPFVLVYSLLHQIFVPVLVYAIVGTPLVLLNYRVNHPKAGKHSAKQHTI